MEYRSNYPQILDGFVYGCLFGTRPFQGCNWYWNCLGNMSPLRLAADDYRPRTWVVPKEFFNPANPNNANILPGETFFYQFQVKPGSYLYGMNLTVFEQNVAQAQFSISVKETQTGLMLWDRPIAASAIGDGFPQNLYNTLFPTLFLLPEPRLMVEPGMIDVEVSNDTDPADDENAVSVQLALFFAEPKR